MEMPTSDSCCARRLLPVQTLATTARAIRLDGAKVASGVGGRALLYCGRPWTSRLLILSETHVKEHRCLI
jgi:hypothetical protein